MELSEQLGITEEKEALDRGPGCCQRSPGDRQASLLSLERKPRPTPLPRWRLDTRAYGHLLDA